MSPSHTSTTSSAIDQTIKPYISHSIHPSIHPSIHSSISHPVHTHHYEALFRSVNEETDQHPRQRRKCVSGSHRTQTRIHGLIHFPVPRGHPIDWGLGFSFLSFFFCVDVVVVVFFFQMNFKSFRNNQIFRFLLKLERGESLRVGLNGLCDSRVQQV